ncbi:O-antigen ligase family protein [Exiguobacterium sp. s36]|uniref:O-antigen ligase family protein n=1 Tax=Exiguobacterium sp. s36 TaxID=2751227 RepID=UPI001BECA75D|nr:O-antigen ligase family protein [Exiguobacterium sp. s36]
MIDQILLLNVFFFIGIVLFLVSEIRGKHILYLSVIPIMYISLLLTDDLYLMDFYGENTQNILGIHPFAISLIVIIFLETLKWLLHTKKRNILIPLLTISMVFIVIILSLLSGNGGGFSLLLHNYVLPFGTFFVLFVIKDQIEVTKIKSILNIYIIISVLIVVYAICEYLFKSNVFEVGFKNSGALWFDSVSREGYRVKTIIGHPLDNAAVFIFTMIVIHMNIRKETYKYILLLIMLIGIFLTGSRAALLIAILVMIYNEKSSNIIDVKKIKSLGVSFFSLMIATVVLFTTSFGNTLLNRIGFEDNSSQARLILVDYFFKNLGHVSLNGLGYATENIKIKYDAYNTIILENPWIILYFDLSYFMFIYLIFLLYLIYKSRYSFLLILFVIYLSSYNSFGVKNNMNFVLYLLLAFGYFFNYQQNIFVTNTLESGDDCNERNIEKNLL